MVAIRQLFSTFPRQIWLFALLVSVGCGVRAQEDEALSAFTARVVGVINSKDFAQRRDLAHPMSLPCLDGDARDLFEETFLQQARPPVPPSYKTEVRTVVTGQRLPNPHGYEHEYAVHPTHWIRISFPDGLVIKNIHLLITRDGGQWREVWACPSAEKLRQIRANQARFDSDCTGAPADAALELPVPMKSWLSVRCLSVGHALGGTDSAVWVDVGTQERLGVFLAQCKGSDEQSRHGHYFTRFQGIELEEGNATSEERRQNVFSDETTHIWKLSASTNKGATILFYFATARADTTRMRVAVRYGPDCDIFKSERYFVRLW